MIESRQSYSKESRVVFLAHPVYCITYITRTAVF